MKKLLILTFLFTNLILGFSQKVEVISLDQKIEKMPRIGLATYIELDKSQVENLWKKQLKEYGKVEKQNGVYYVNVAQIKSISSGNLRIISQVESTSQGTMVWFAIDKGSSFLTKGDAGYKEAEKLLYDFGVLAYRDDVMEQVKEAEKEHSKALKNQEKTVKTGETLADNLKKNAENKINLEQKIVENAAEKVQLEKDTEQNLADQKKASEELEIMQKTLDAVKQRLNDIH